MSAVRDVLFDWLLNASVQIGLFALLAALLSPFIAKAKAKYQHTFYLAILVLGLAAPVVNTLWQAEPRMNSHAFDRQPIQAMPYAGSSMWVWNWYSSAHKSNVLVPAAKSAVLAIWQIVFLYQMILFSRRIYRVHRLRKDASLIHPGEIGISGLTIEPLHGIVVLKSTSVDDPVTVGLLHPAIILPSKVIAALDETDLAAILAHEFAHIRRKDFLVLVLCQLTALPVAWHPGIRYLMAKASQTREIACDESAAVQLGKPKVYARTLLRLASLCLQTPRGNAMGLGIFDGDNLEDRIMMLTEKKGSLSRAGLIGLAFAMSLLFASCAVLARAVSLQEASTTPKTTQMFVGTWHWMFHRQSFATMILVQKGSGISGTVTGSKIALGDDGELSRADPTDNSAPTPITNANMEGNGLHVTVMDDNQPFEFVVTLKDASHAEIHPIGAPPNMKPIQAERVN